MTLINRQTTDTGTTSGLSAALRHTLELPWDRSVRPAGTLRPPGRTSGRPA
jgi:hypothetical protein